MTASQEPHLPVVTRTIWDPKALLVVAEQIAREAHEGQVDKMGRPYWWHLQRVALRLSDPWDAAIAWLHDTLEDTPLTPADLLDAGVPAALVESVVTLTRRHDESYVDFISRIIAADERHTLGLDTGDSRPRRVKIADVMDNLNPDRGLDNRGLQRRYYIALDRLLHDVALPERSEESGEIL